MSGKPFHLALTPRKALISAVGPGFLTFGFLLAAPSHPIGQWPNSRFRSDYSGGGRAGLTPASLNPAALLSVMTRIGDGVKGGLAGAGRWRTSIRQLETILDVAAHRGGVRFGEAEAAAAGDVEGLLVENLVTGRAHDSGATHPSVGQQHQLDVHLAAPAAPPRHHRIAGLGTVHTVAALIAAASRTVPTSSPRTVA